MLPNPTLVWLGQEDWGSWATQWDCLNKGCAVWTRAHKSMISFLLRHLELCFLITRRDLIITRESERSTGGQKETKGSVQLLRPPPASGRRVGALALLLKVLILCSQFCAACLSPPQIYWAPPGQKSCIYLILYCRTQACSLVSVSTEYLTHKEQVGKNNPPHYSSLGQPHHKPCSHCQ